MRFIRSVSLLAALACAGAALAAQNRTPPRDAFYRCKDSNGQTYYGDSKPPACEGLDTEVLNDRGIVMRVIEGTQSRTAREQREVTESRARKELEARAQHDRMLIETFLNVEDIERLRDQRLELLRVAQDRVHIHLQELPGLVDRLQVQGIEHRHRRDAVQQEIDTYALAALEAQLTNDDDGLDEELMP